jgi:hypothetical protein
VTEPVLWHRLSHVHRIWVVMFPPGNPPRHYDHRRGRSAFCLQHAWNYSLNLVLLYRRCGSAGPA